MSEEELRDGLRAAVADEPPLAFDPDALMARAQREVKRRRALFGAGLATAAVAVAAVAVPTMLGTPRSGGTAGSPGQALEGCANEPASGPVPLPVPSEPAEITFSASSLPGSFTVLVPATDMPPSLIPSLARPEPSAGTPTPPPGGTPLPTPLPEPPASPCPPSSAPPPSSVPPPSGSVIPAPTFEWPPPGMAAKHYTAAQLRQRGAEMRAHLKSRFGKVVEGATNVAVQEFGGEASGAVSDGQSYLDTFVAYTLKDARSAVGISVFAPGAGMSPAEQCAEGEGTCAMSEWPDGTKLVITTLRVGGEDNKASILSVSAYRPNGTVVRASGYNYDPTGKEGLKVLPDMPVTVDQLTALATDPKLAL